MSGIEFKVHLTDAEYTSLGEVLRDLRVGFEDYTYILANAKPTDRLDGWGALRERFHRHWKALDLVYQAAARQGINGQTKGQLTQQ